MDTYLGYLTAWRGWNIKYTRGGSLRLTSLLDDFVWPPGAAFGASCHQHPDTVPSLECSCGIYAYSDEADILASRGLHWVGQVALWGRVVKHEKGMRAEFAYPLNITHAMCVHCHRPFPLNEVLMVPSSSGQYVPFCQQSGLRAYPLSAIQRQTASLLAQISETYGIPLSGALPATPP